MHDDWWPWILRILWVSLPFTMGPLIGDALGGTSRPVQLTGTTGAWVVWAVGLATIAVPHVVTLTPMRIIVPAAFVGAVWATGTGGVSAWSPLALAITAAAAAVALSPSVGSTFVNGSSYGDERRVPLRPPGSLLVGPIPMAWALTVAAVTAVPMLLAAKVWILGAIVALLGLPAAFVLARALHALAKRWLVFVPAGVVVHDHMAVPEPILFKRTAIETLGPALAGTTAVDLSMNAAGLALELAVREPVELDYRPEPGGEPQSARLRAVVISPSRPGWVLERARERRIPVG